MAHERILVVEDDENIQELLRYNLAREGYAVDVAGTGEEGLKLARALPPDLIVLDRNIFEGEPEAISGTRVLTTYFEGRPVYRADA